MGRTTPGARLNLQQAEFKHLYLAGPDGVRGNATESYLRAYRATCHSRNVAKANGSRLLNSNAMQRAVAKALNKIDVDTERVLLELKSLGFSDARRVMRWGKRPRRTPNSGNGADDAETPDAQPAQMQNFVDLFNSDDLSDFDAAGVAGVKETAHGVTVRMHDKVAALKLLGEHKGIFKRRIEVTGVDGEPLITIDQIRAILGEDVDEPEETET